VTPAVEGGRLDHGSRRFPADGARPTRVRKAHEGALQVLRRMPSVKIRGLGTICADEAPGIWLFADCARRVRQAIETYSMRSPGVLGPMAGRWDRRFRSTQALPRRVKAWLAYYRQRSVPATVARYGRHYRSHVATEIAGPATGSMRKTAGCGDFTGRW